VSASDPCYSPTRVQRELRLAPDPFALARALASRPGLALLASSVVGAFRGEDARYSFVACEPVERTRALVPPLDGGSWVGALPYECARSLERPAWTRAETRAAPLVVEPLWLRYDAVVRVDHRSGVVAIEADDARAASRLERALRAGMGARSGDAELTPLPPEELEHRHVDRVREVLRFIARGDVYQVNLARRLSYGLRGDPLAIFERMFAAAPSPYALYLDLGDAVVCATSPELALELRGDRLRTSPIKGTRPRGADAASDTLLARELDRDAKERAELTMAIDLHRNDLGRVAVPGSVRTLGAPRVVAGRTVHSRVAEIVARKAAAATADDVVRAMLPCGSVTGAPKIRAMEIIASLEPWRRGLYTGMLGHVTRDGALVLAMAIRTLEIDPRLRRAVYFTGGGIVADSDPARELEETRWKAAHLLHHSMVPFGPSPAFGGAH
jgi:para-aminobenzoate synthetase component 1